LHKNSFESRDRISTFVIGSIAGPGGFERKPSNKAQEVKKYGREKD
jgi:hypothetical protein